MVAPVRESKFWEFADTFCNGDLAETLRVMRRMFAQGESPVGAPRQPAEPPAEMVVLSDCLKRGWARLSGGEGWRTLRGRSRPKAKPLLAAPRKRSPQRQPLCRRP